MHLGVWLDAGSRIRPLPAQLSRHEAVAEAIAPLGYDAVWIGESYSQGMPAPFQWLASLARATPLRLGIGVLLLPAWHPLRLLCESAVLDQLSGGRFELGVGVARPALQERFGVTPGTVARYADEVLAMLRAIWQEGKDRYDGTLVHVESSGQPGPVQAGGPPIWVGGQVRASATRAAMYGVGWYASTTYTTSQIERLIANYESACDEVGRAVGERRVAANRLALVATSDREARELAIRYLAPVMQRYARNGSLGDDWRTPPGPEETFDRLSEELCIVGSPETVSRRLEKLRALGVTHLHARLMPDEMPQELAIETARGLAEGMAGTIQPSTGA